MPLESASEIMAHARRNRYAVGYFESWDLASLEGAIDAAEQSHAPTIIGFNGDFLARHDRAAPARLAWYGALARAAAESAQVPCAVMFNECPRDSWVECATQVGFNLVMLADATAKYDEITLRVANLVDRAHSRGVAVEAELGVLPCGAEERDGGGGVLTDPDRAAEFVRATGIDLLAVSVGNVHILLQGQQNLDLERLAAIRRKVDIPLVLHGGTGITAESLTQAIALGVAKINYGTYLKQRCLAELRRAIPDSDINPHHALGYGGDADLLVITRRAVRNAILERIGILGCCGQG